MADWQVRSPAGRRYTVDAETAAEAAEKWACRTRMTCLGAALVEVAALTNGAPGAIEEFEVRTPIEVRRGGQIVRRRGVFDAR